MNQGQQQAVKYDELYTPEYAVFPLLPYLFQMKDFLERNDLKCNIWECCGNNSTITKVLRHCDFTVFETHIDDGIDFLKDDPDFEYHLIITNPPYSIKDQFLKRAYELEVPFAFLLPITALAGVKRGKMYRQNGVQVLVLDKRVDYTGKGNNWKNTSWFCWNLLPADLVFAKLDKEVKL